MRIKLLALGLIVASATLLVAHGVSAQSTSGTSTSELASTPPDATIDFEASQLRLIIGGSSGKGVLHYKDKDYPFTMSGASVGGIGGTNVTGAGTVHYLKTVADFAGTYSGIGAGAALGEGKGSSSFQNGSGVVISVKSKSEGVALNLGVSAVTVKMVQQP